MRLYFYGFILLFKKFVLRRNTGEAICSFVEKMGVVYIKFAQLLAMQNVGNLFTEKDRLKLVKICDHCNPIPFGKIRKQIEEEYGCTLGKKFKKVFATPIGSASISQVHKAILKNGDVVAIKVKRKDITKRIEKDIKQIRNCIHRFGRFFHFKNYLGGDLALTLYLQWIQEETDFQKEKNNILEFYRFTKSVNDSIPNTKHIVVPKVYKKLCTENILVMEFITAKTINQMELTPKNKEKIGNSLNDYLSLSFYALLHDKQVTFHGDPHGGNVYIEKNGDIGFLDMGLIFTFSKEEAKFIRTLFIAAYTENIDELAHLLIDGSKRENVDYEALKKEYAMCCSRFKNISVPQFFVEMMCVYTKYNIEPDPIFYKMAKAFVSLYGMNTFLENNKSAEDLVQSLLIDFYIRRAIFDVKDLTNTGLSFLPKFIKNTMKKGIFQSIPEQIFAIKQIHDKMRRITKHTEEIFSLIKS